LPSRQIVGSRQVANRGKKPIKFFFRSFSRAEAFVKTGND